MHANNSVPLDTCCYDTFQNQQARICLLYLPLLELLYQNLKQLSVQQQLHSSSLNLAVDVSLPLSPSSHLTCLTCVRV